MFDGLIYDGLVGRAAGRRSYSGQRPPFPQWVIRPPLLLIPEMRAERKMLLRLVLLLCAALGGVRGAVPYFGAEIGVLQPGGGREGHGVQGTVYAVDDRTLFVRGFAYDGQGPEAWVWGGASEEPDDTGFIIPDEKGKKAALRAYSGEDVLLRLPQGRTTADLAWIAVRCKGCKTSFGWVAVSVVAPAPVSLGPLASHGSVSSGPVTVVDTHTLLVTDFNYDDSAPSGAYFWASRGARQHPRGIRLPDEEGRLSALGPYSKKTVVVSLPADVSVHDVDWFGVWGAGEDLGSVRIPPALHVPPSPRTLGVQLEYKLNCEVLRDDLGFEVRWIMDGEDLVLQLVARIDRNEYLSLGLSRNDSRSAMEKADALVAWTDARGKGHAADYYLGTKEQCSGSGRGSCPDSRLEGGRDGVTLLNAASVNGYTMLTLKRPQLGVDEKYDQHVYSDGPQAVVWAVGPVSDKGEISYHSTLRSQGDVYIDFARSPQWNCPQPADVTEAPPPTPPTSTTPRPTKKPVAPPTKKPKWAAPPIVCPEDTTLRFQMGPAPHAAAGGALVWYVNGVPQPELRLERGRAYTLLAEGGDQHPLYVTDDPEGGAAQHAAKKERFFAGVTEDRRGGKLNATARGRLCEWRLPRHASADSFSSFDAFQEQLELRCSRGRPAHPLALRTDAPRTPQTLYYQSFSRRHLGGKIRLVDSCEGVAAASAPRPVVSDLSRKSKTTTTTPAPSHPATMESFKLRDVVHRYSEPRRPPGRRPPHAAALPQKQWWHDHAVAASQHRPQQQKQQAAPSRPKVAPSTGGVLLVSSSSSRGGQRQALVPLVLDSRGHVISLLGGGKGDVRLLRL